MSRVANAGFVLSTVLWASFHIVAKGLLERLDPWLFVALDLSFLVPVALVMVAVTRRTLDRNTLLMGGLLGGVLYLDTAASSLALASTTATNTALIAALNGLIAAFITVGVLRRSLAPGTWLSGGALVVGAGLLVFGSPGDGSLIGDAFAFAAAFFYTVYLFLVDAFTRRAAASPWGLFGVELLTMAALSGIGLLLFGDGAGLRSLAGGDVVVVLYAALATTFVPVALSLLFQRYTRPVTVAFIVSLESVWSLALAYLVLGETLGGPGLVGAGLIVVGALGGGRPSGSSGATLPTPEARAFILDGCRPKPP